MGLAWGRIIDPPAGSDADLPRNPFCLAGPCSILAFRPKVWPTGAVTRRGIVNDDTLPLRSLRHRDARGRARPLVAARRRRAVHVDDREPPVRVDAVREPDQ